MNGFFLVIPIILIRYAILGMISKAALQRAAYFAPLQGGEKFAFAMYQISNTLMFLYLIFLRVKTEPPIFYAALLVYILGMVLYIISTVDYARPDGNGVNLKGLYKVSRNPMYVAYLIYFTGCALLTKSLLLFMLLLIFQLSSHWIIYSEERWCIESFGAQYTDYMKKVRRYI
ncbi:MAG: phospholipid methyltransferase [Clostridia bacterium]|jgi:protein-S-isoprenylcysteine O-methyltransferase Ste14|nr:phospholipid methyltransferase [Clostridia bacterium]